MKNLIDPYGRKIDYLRVSITDRCNLRCAYCVPGKGVELVPRHQVLRYEEIIEIAKIAISCGIKRIRITGGDPLVKRDVVKLIGSLANIEGLEDLSLTTNGILLSKYARDLYSAGLKRINIGCDTLDEVKFSKLTQGGDLKKVISGIDAAKQAGFSPIKLNVVLLKGINEDEVLDFALLAKDFPLIVRFIELMPISPKKIFKEERFLSLIFAKNKL
ncbi:radical SAM protein, partial [bacterium]|nr:radical SAM protein [bacterium]